jgi:hypothetical protein
VFADYLIVDSTLTHTLNSEVTPALLSGGRSSSESKCQWTMVRQWLEACHDLCFALFSLRGEGMFVLDRSLMGVNDMGADDRWTLGWAMTSGSVGGISFEDMTSRG